MSPRQKLGKGRYGPHGRSVALWIEGHLIRALYRVQGRRVKKSWPNTVENRKIALAWAQAFGEARVPHVQVLLTTDELWQRYTEAEFPTLRPRSQVLYSDYWRAWEVFVTRSAIADDLGAGTLAQFRANREAHGWGSATIGQAIKTVKTVYAWAYRLKLISRNDVRDYRYKVAKERRPESPAEYTPAEFAAIAAQLPLDRGTTWRAGAVFRLCGYQGARQGAVLKLQWSDVGEDGITWRAEWDKVGRARTQPLRAESRVVLAMVKAQHDRRGLTSSWLFPVGSRKSERTTYSAQSLWAAVKAAEARAGIAHRAGRSTHGTRRMHFHDVLAAGGDVGDAMAAIGDSDLRVASRYLKARQAKLAGVYAVMDEGKGPRNSTGADRAPTKGQ